MYPSVTVLLTTCEHGPYISAAVQSMLQQDYPGPLQILISDDASTDETWPRLQQAVAAYHGPHDVIARINDKRMGETAHFGHLLTLARGELLINANGDDLHPPERVRRLVEAWRSTGAAAVSSNAVLLDANGQPRRRWAQETTHRHISAQEIVERGFSEHTLGATFAIHRKLMDDFGWFNPDEYAGAPDLVLPLRAALTDGFFFVADALLGWRQHASQQTEQIASRALQPRVFRALQDIHLTHGRMQCLRDLQRLSERVPQHGPTLRALEERLREKILEELDWRCRVEATLWAQGKRVRWV